MSSPPLITAEDVERFVDEKGGIMRVSLEDLEQFRTEHEESLDPSGEEKLSEHINIKLYFRDGD